MGVNIAGGQGPKIVSVPYVEVNTVGCSRGRKWSLVKEMTPTALAFVPFFIPVGGPVIGPGTSIVIDLAAKLALGRLPDDRIKCAGLGTDQISLSVSGGAGSRQGWSLAR